VLGHPITVYSDNKALTFLKRCNLTSGRITRWVLQLQECDLNIVHINGANNLFADILSRDPIGLSQEERDQFMRPNEVFVRKVNLGTDKTLMKELGNLSKHQKGDPRTYEIQGRLGEKPNRLAREIQDL
jgi:hypothetical protein